MNVDYCIESGPVLERETASSGVDEGAKEQAIQTRIEGLIYTHTLVDFYVLLCGWGELLCAVLRGVLALLSASCNFEEAEKKCPFQDFSSLLSPSRSRTNLDPFVKGKTLQINLQC